jgi:hypothetical protein
LYSALLEHYKQDCAPGLGLDVDLLDNKLLP